MNAKQTRQAARAKSRAARKAAFFAARDAGKSKRDADSVSSFRPWKHAHLVADCGNVGCPRCGHPAEARQERREQGRQGGHARSVDGSGVTIDPSGGT